MKEAVIFDIDGVLVNSMPFHYKAMSIAIKEITNIDLDKRTFYLLEGMPVAEMALEILRLNVTELINTFYNVLEKRLNKEKKRYLKK